MAAKKTAKKTAGKTKKKTGTATSKASPPVATATPLKKPLTIKQKQSLLKMGDTDRAIAARVGKTLGKLKPALVIPGVDSAAILDGVRASEAIVSEETVLEQRAALLASQRLIADDKVWKAVTKLHRRLVDEGEDSPEALAELEFLMEYMAKRSKGHGGGGSPPPAGGTSKS